MTTRHRLVRPTRSWKPRKSSEERQGLQSLRTMSRAFAPTVRVSRRRTSTRIDARNERLHVSTERIFGRIQVPRLRIHAARNQRELMPSPRDCILPKGTPTLCVHGSKSNLCFGLCVTPGSRSKFVHGTIVRATLHEIGLSISRVTPDRCDLPNEELREFLDQSAVC